jgi:hypothetical protein
MKYFLPFVFLLLGGTGIAQSLPGSGFNKIRINEPERSLQFEIVEIKRDHMAESDLTYYWYSANRIHQTQGGFSGKLLNGPYYAFDNNKNLREQGAFIKGLKDGIWKSWNDNGRLVASVTWNNGEQSGPFTYFDETGKVKQTGTFHKGLLHGEIKEYAGADSVKTVSYRNGLLMKPEPHISIWQKLHLKKASGDTLQVRKPAKQPKAKKAIATVDRSNP